MNARILDLIKNPEILKAEDLSLLAPEIERLPYMQSLRAIYLLGVHQFQNENFQQELTKTAAYTTDKKILYHFINKSQRSDIKKEAELVKNFSENTDNKDITSTIKQENTIEKERKPNLVGIDFYARNQPNSAENAIITKEKSTLAQPEKYEPKASIMDFYASPKRIESSLTEPKNTVSSSIDFYQKNIVIEEKATKESPEKEENTEALPQWRPMNIESFSSPTSQEKIINEDFEEEKEEEKLMPEEKEITIEPTQTIENEIENHIETSTSQSNVPQFINTWQNWLNATPPPSNREKTFAIIDKFIENNPKMPPANEEVEFVVKEKSDDISHLMTETLAQLYWEQKLYSKAINAYKILQEKYPERTEEFEEMIEEIKKTRNK